MLNPPTMQSIGSHPQGAMGRHTNSESNAFDFGYSTIRRCREMAAEAFVRSVENAGNSTRSGLVGASYVLQALVKAGRRHCIIDGNARRGTIVGLYG